MGFLIIPIGVFLAIVAILVLKDFKADTAGKRTIKILVVIAFVLAFIVSSYFMIRR